MGDSHVARIVRTEVRRRVRAASRDDHRVGLVALVVPAYLLGLVVVFGWASSQGQALAAGTTGGALALVDLAVARIVTVGTLLVCIRVLASTGRPAAFEAVLTGARHRSVVSAYLALESGLLLVLFGPAFLVAGVGIALGAGSAVTGVLVVTTAVATVLVAAWGGFVAGLGVRLVLARSRLLARYRLALGGLVALAYVFGLAWAGSSSLFAPTDRLVELTPLAWISDVVLLGLPGEADAIRAVGAVVALAALLIGLFASNTWLAARLWYRQTVDASPSRARLSRSWLVGVDRQTRHVVHKTWTRAIRSPLRLVYVGYAGLLVAFMLVNAVQHGDWPAWLPVSIGLYGAWATGAGFTLNPIGEEAPILPATLTTPISGRRYVRSLWIASIVPGVPLTVVLTAVVAVGAGFGLVDLVLVCLLGAGLAALSPGLAAGIGARFPKTNPEAITQNRHAVVPSGGALLGYSLALVVLVVPFWSAVASSGLQNAAVAVGLPRATVVLAGSCLTLFVAGIAAVASYRSAGARFDEYDLAQW